MKYALFALPLFFFLPAQAETQLKLDTAGAEAWLSCTKAQGRPADCNAASARTKGGTLAELAIPTFGTLPAEHPTDSAPSQASALLDAIKGWNLATLESEPKSLVPLTGRHAGHIYIVGNGAHDWGDAYVRNYRWSDGKPVLDDSGEPAILINLRLVARYRGTPAEQAETISGIVRHEMFHIYFAWYRAEDPRWQKLRTPSKEQDLLLTVEDEGIAHFLADENDLKAKGFPQDHATKALSDLVGAVEALHSGSASDALLQRANQGAYWSKYGAISGAYFAYGIDKVFRSEGLKQSIMEGPAAFILKYGKAASQDSALLPLPETLRTWAEEHRADLD